MNKNKFPVGNYFRLNRFIGYVSHVSKKGQIVGYVFVNNKWFGPVVWNKFGSSELKRSDFDVVDGKFQAGNCLNRGPELKDILPVKDLLMELQKEKQS